MIKKLRRLVVVAAALLCAGSAQAQRSVEILIFGGEGHKEFLGCLTCSDSARDSVWNEYSRYGWGNAYAVWNSYGPHRGEFGSRSACNEYASDPPVLVDRSGTFYGLLTINEYKRGSICGSSGAERVCTALKVMCAGA